MLTIALSQALSIGFFFEKCLVFFPSTDEMAGLDIILQTGIGLNPLGLPFISSDVLDDSNALKRLGR